MSPQYRRNYATGYRSHRAECNLPSREEIHCVFHMKSHDIFPLMKLN